MKKATREGFAFTCDRCGAVAGFGKTEAEALERAREVARAFKWQWNHPGWGLSCPRCNIEVTT